MKATKLAFKGHSLPARFSDHGFWLATIGVYYAMGVPFGEGFLPTSDTSGHLCFLTTTKLGESRNHGSTSQIHNVAKNQNNAIHLPKP